MTDKLTVADLNETAISFHADLAALCKQYATRAPKIDLGIMVYGLCLQAGMLAGLNCGTAMASEIMEASISSFVDGMEQAALLRDPKGSA